MLFALNFVEISRFFFFLSLLLTKSFIMLRTTTVVEVVNALPMSNGAIEFTIAMI